MSIPGSRDDFTDYVMRRLGRGVIEINVSEDQIQDRIDEAILYWQDFNSDATQRQLYKYQLTATDLANQYITLPSNIIGVVKILDPGDAFNNANIFNIRYQIALNDLYTLTSVSMAPYYMAFSHIQLLDELLVGFKPIRFNRISNILYLDFNMQIFVAGAFIIVDSYQTIDPTVYPALWGNRPLQNLATAYIKKQWGGNLMKFGNMPMPGGITFNGELIYKEAIEDIEKAEREIRKVYELPHEFQIG